MTNIFPDTDSQKPVLVYGTLRPSCGNYEVFLRGHTVTEEDIRIKGFAMYGTSGFPYVMADADGSIVATLVTVKPGHYEHVLEGLDFLEGYRGEGKSNHYERRSVTLRGADGEKVEAWIYVIEGAHAEQVKSNYAPTPDGDWKASQAHAARERRRAAGTVGSSFYN